MNRKDFIRACTLLGLSIPFNSFLTVKPHKKYSKPGRIIIIGAGAAGLSVGYLLKQRGVDFNIIEADSQLGGRMKINNSFADFPIPLGAEWISSENIDFSILADNEKVLQHIKTADYLPNDEYWVRVENKLLRNTLNTFIDKKFINSSWFDFFKTFVVPDIENNIQYDTKITSIDYSKTEVLLKADQEEFVADQVIITAPLSILKSKEISFSPTLPERKLSAFDKVTYWGGFKAFFEFEQKFYPAFVDYLIQPETNGQVSLYDAAWGQESEKHILGLFSVGAPAKKYGDLTDAVFKSQFLEELDQIFEGRATKYYIKHITQNWSKEPFAKGAYASDFTDPETLATLRESVNNKLYFAGDAYTDGTDWGNVHNAIYSARQCVEMILKENQ
ncbi:FAD-dependent oxidoreductase [Fulvivirgaceae bacterium BMA12]|uniref:Tryptophan 2-monooxygenase n=1 Tax=Agaribacillus aureus TaxID=3051825 RepID=A0ABT8L5J9_9BACT|nr:FAD-dependent oxidoreductase [Fulvivirgaceae bacterium BMA12]